MDCQSNLSGQCARGGLIDTEDVAEESEVLRRDGRSGHAELAADDLGEGAHGVALIGDSVSHRAGSGLFQGEPEEPGGVEAVDGRPALAAVADIAGDCGAPGSSTARAECPLPSATCSLTVTTIRTSRPVSARRLTP